MEFKRSTYILNIKNFTLVVPNSSSIDAATLIIRSQILAQFLYLSIRQRNSEYLRHRHGQTECTEVVEQSTDVALQYERAALVLYHDHSCVVESVQGRVSTALLILPMIDVLTTRIGHTAVSAGGASETLVHVRPVRVRHVTATAVRLGRNDIQKIIGN